MRRKNSRVSRASFARGFLALFAIMLAMGLGFGARPAEAAPFAYVANNGSNTVSVIDTATNSVVATVALGVNVLSVAVAPDGKRLYVGVNVSSVLVIDTATNTLVATIPVGNRPDAVAVTPDGKHVYVVIQGPGNSGNVSVIETASNTVVGTPIPVGTTPFGIAITPEGKRAYVTNDNSHTVSVIETASKTVAATVPVGNFPTGVAVTPDGTRAYVAIETFPAGIPAGTISVIETATNTVVATIAVGSGPLGVAVTPDGKHAYVANDNSNTVSVIETATNTVAATVAVGSAPLRVAVTPDGKHAYVTNDNSNTVSVIDTASNTVVATVSVGSGPLDVAIVPPPQGVPFLAFNAKLEIDLERKPNKDRFELKSRFTLSSTATNGIHPLTEPVTLQVGSFTTTIPPGSFKKYEDEDDHEHEHEHEHGHGHEDGFFTFRGVIGGVRLEALIKRTGTLRYAFDAEARHANLTGTKNPVPVMLTISDDSGTTSVKARISQSGE